MHIPDGLMSPLVAAVGWIVSIVFIALAVKLTNKRLEEKQIPFMAVLAAGIFVVQMLNFPVGGGTTGHLVGAALAAVLLGPVSGMIVMVAILLIQALLFGDGGITAFGLNVLNMAVVGSFVGWYSYRLISPKSKEVGMFVASWLAVFAGAFFCTVQLALSYSMSGGAYGIDGSIAVPAMLGYHALIGIGEGIIATGVVVYLSKVSPDMLKMPKITIRGVTK